MLPILTMAVAEFMAAYFCCRYGGVLATVVAIFCVLIGGMFLLIGFIKAESVYEKKEEE